MAELIKNPDTMKKLQDEMRGIVKPNDMIKTEALTKIEYLKAVTKEILRLHPPVPLLLPRQSMEECEIDGFTIPKGTRVLINFVQFRGTQDHGRPPEQIGPGLLFATGTAELALANLVHQFECELPSGMTSDQSDMSDAPGFAVLRKNSLQLVIKQVILSD